MIRLTKAEKQFLENWYRGHEETHRSFCPTKYMSEADMATLRGIVGREDSRELGIKYDSFLTIEVNKKIFWEGIKDMDMEADR